MTDSSHIEPPIFIAEGLDLMVFTSIEAAEGEVESPDVDDYEAFDSAGRKLAFTGKTEPHGRFIKTVDVGPVRLLPTETGPGHQEELRQLILRCLRGTSDPQPIDTSATLQELVKEATGRFKVR